MSLLEYEEFVYGAMLCDWEEQDEKQERMREQLENAKNVRIVGPEPDLTMSLSSIHVLGFTMTDDENKASAVVIPPH